MDSDEPGLEISVPAEPVSVRLARREVLRWLREQRPRSDRLAAAVALATSEAVANVVRHAYGKGAGRVDLDARISDDELLVEVRDSGQGLSAGSGAPQGFGGMGLPLIGRVADGVAVLSDEGGTRLTMRFALESDRGFWPLRNAARGLPPQPLH